MIEKNILIDMLLHPFYLEAYENYHIHKTYRFILNLHEELRRTLVRITNYDISKLYPGQMDLTYFNLTNDLLDFHNCHMSIEFDHKFLVYRLSVKSNSALNIEESDNPLGYITGSKNTVHFAPCYIDSMTLVDKPDFEDSRILLHELAAMSMENAEIAERRIQMLSGVLKKDDMKIFFDY